MWHSHCDISKYAYNVPWLGSSSPSFSFISLPALQIDFYRFHCSVVIQVFEVHWLHLPSFKLCIHPPPFTSTHPRQGLIYILSFIKCIFIVQKGFAMVLHLRMYWGLIRLTPHLPYPFLPTPIIQQLSVHFYTFFQAFLNSVKREDLKCYMNTENYSSW
jgi:hypothetical protein